MLRNEQDENDGIDSRINGRRLRDCVQDNVLTLDRTTNGNIIISDLQRIFKFLLFYPNIKTLDVGKNFIDSENIMFLAQENKVITKLNLYASRIGDESLENFAKYNTVVTNLDVQINELTDKGLNKFALYNTVVTHLTITGDFSEDSFTYFAKHNKVTTHLKIHCFFKLTGKKIKGFLENNKLVTHLDLSYNFHIDDNTMSTFSKYNKTVINVKFKYCALSLIGIHALLQGNVLRKIDISGNKQVTPALLKLTKEKMSANKIMQAEWIKSACLIASFRANRDSELKESIIELIPEIAEFSGVPKEKTKVHKQFMNTLFFKSEVKRNPIVESKSRTCNIM
jgi:hypothetical protein